MAIFIVICHGRNQVFVAFHPGFPEVFTDLALTVSRLLGGHAEVLLEISTNLRHDLVSPFRKIKPRTAREPQQRVSQRHRDQDAGVQDYRKIRSHSSWPPSGNRLRSYRPASTAACDNRSRAA